MPPAKSSAPIFWSQPPPHIQWAMGTYTTSDQSAMKRSMALNRTRSANAPMMSAGVITANVSWNIATTVSGTDPWSASRPTPARNAFESPPTNRSSPGEEFGVKTRE